MRTLHPAWPVLVVTTGALLAAAAFRSTTGVLTEPIMHTTGWPLSVLSGAASLNLIVYGLATPFAAALMQVWGVRRTVVAALLVVAAAAAATVAVQEPWQLYLLWGPVIGVGTGALALTFGTIVANRWFVTHRGLVTGIFSAATAAGQVLFVPLFAAIAAGPGWQVAEFVTAACALLFALASWVWLRDRPSDLGVRPYGADAPAAEEPAADVAGDALAEPPVRATLRVLREGLPRWSFVALLLTFFVCGWSTNGIVVLGLVPAAHDHGMPATLAASLIAIIGIFDIVGTVASGWLTDRFDPRLLLAGYYVTRGLSLFVVHHLLGPHVSVPLWAWIVFYGLDWTATVPPTVALCRELVGLDDSGVAFGWAYAVHMIGAGLGAAASAGIRESTGSYELAWIVAAVLCVTAGLIALTIRRRRAPAHAQPVVAW